MSHVDTPCVVNSHTPQFGEYQRRVFDIMFSKVLLDDNTIVSRGQYLRSLPRLSSRDEEQLALIVAKIGLPNSLSALGASRAVQTLVSAYSDEDAVKSFTVAVLRDIASWLELEVYPSCYHSIVTISVLRTVTSLFFVSSRFVVFSQFVGGRLRAQTRSL